ncbi:hypothetical protein QIW31_07565 [Francisellaceae bacterium CB299]|jgi:hypothetical protein
MLKKPELSDFVGATNSSYEKRKCFYKKVDSEEEVVLLFENSDIDIRRDSSKGNWKEKKNDKDVRAWCDTNAGAPGDCPWINDNR